MGQKFGKSKLNPIVVPFTNLSRAAIGKIWKVFNDLADSFGISLEELTEILSELSFELNMNRNALKNLINHLFMLMDTDNNGVIDALEVCVTLASLSAMRFNEIIYYILHIYDFDDSSTLSVDEVTLCLKSLTIGLCKISKDEIPPSENFIEELVTKVFIQEFGTTIRDTSKLKISRLVDLLCIHPDIYSWYSYFGDPNIASNSKNDSDIISKPSNTDRSFNFTWNLESKISTKEDLVANPWLASVQSLMPIKFSGINRKANVPNGGLELEWVFGYQSDRCSNNLFYNCDGDIVYNISRYVVIYNTERHSQRIFTVHENEISALCVHPNKLYSASGEFGADSIVVVWNTQTFEILFHAKILSQFGIQHISFSSDGQYLSILSSDIFNTVYLYQWESRTLLYSSHVDSKPVVATAFLNDMTLVVGGCDYMYYWIKTADGYMKRKGIFSKHIEEQTLTCLVPIEYDHVVTGTSSGLLMLWVDRSCVRFVRAHEGSVIALHSNSKCIISGGKDFRVRVWSFDLLAGSTFDISHFGHNPVIKALVLSADGATIAIGSGGANIYEINAADGADSRGGSITKGHYLGNLNAMSVHPSKLEAVSVGDDGYIMIWDLRSKLLLRSKDLRSPITAVTYSNFGDCIALGLGGVDNPKCGTFIILSEEDLTILYEAKDSTCSVSILKYSPDGEILAIGTDDGVIYLYGVNDEYELIGRCLRHTDRITHLDFSVDGQWIRSNSRSKELYFFSTDDASFQSNLSVMRDLEFASSTCVFGWHVKSVQTTCWESEYVTTLDVPMNSEMPILTCGTSLGYIKIHNYPCPAADKEYFHRYEGHVGKISDSRFTYDSSYLVTSGESDRAILIWKFVASVQSDRVDEAEDLESDDFIHEAIESSEIEDEMMPRCLLDQYIDETKTHNELPSQCNIWSDNIVNPAVQQKDNKDIPDVSLVLEYAYGFRSQDMRNNVCYTSSGDIAYPCSTMGVVMSRSNRNQRFYQHHDDRITAFACSKDGKYIATGNMGHNPIVTIWSPDSCERIATMPDRHYKAVSALSFSNSGIFLAVSTADMFNTITIYDWRHTIVISRTHGGIRKILSIAFSDDDKRLCGCGIKSIMFWKNIQSRHPTAIKPTFNEIGKIQTFTTCLYFNNNPIVASFDGHIYIFLENSLVQTIRAHDGPIYAMSKAPDNSFVCTGSKDGFFRAWNKSFECIHELSVANVINASNDIQIRSLDVSSDGTRILFATSTADIFEMSLKSARLVGSYLLSCHGKRELWGLATHPTKEEFITAGDDGAIRIFDPKTFKMIKSIKIDTPCRCVTYSPNGKYIALGLGSGKQYKDRLSAQSSREGVFVILTASDHKVYHEGRDSNESIRVIKFTSDNAHLACGSDDSRIYIYNVRDHFSRRAVVSCHKAPIRFIDFSMDNNFMMSVDSSMRIHYSEVVSGIEVNSPLSFRDEKWSTHSSPVGWAVQGFWKRFCHESEIITTAQRSHGKQLISVGSNCGRLIVTHYPCFNFASCCTSFGHSGPIANIAWLADDGKILTVGQKDHSILQWKVVYNDSRESGDEDSDNDDDSVIDFDSGYEYTHNDSLQKRIDFIKAPRWIQFIDTHAKVNNKSNIKKFDTINPQLYYCHGARIQDCRQSLHYNIDGSIIFIASTLVVVFSRHDFKQCCYDQHNSPVICLNLNASLTIVASGDMSNNPELHIWNSRTTAQICVFKDMHRKGISSIVFSDSGNILVSLAQDIFHSFSVFRSSSGSWEDGILLYSSTVTTSRMLWVLYIENAEYPVIVGGKNTLYYFRQKGKGAEKIKGEFGKRRKIQTLLCASHIPVSNLRHNEVITGTHSGHIYHWSHKGHISASISAHDSPIYSLLNSRIGIVSGDKDGIINIWNHQWQKLYSYDSKQFSPRPLILSCHSVGMNHACSKLVVGLKGGNIYEITLSTNSHILLSESHSKGQLYGLVANPQISDEFATSGDDGFIKIWSLSLCRCIKQLFISNIVRTIAWSPDGKFVVGGIGSLDSTAISSTKDGAFIVIDTHLMQIVHENRKAKKSISAIKYSRSGEIVALSSIDGKLFIHNATSYNLISTIDIPGLTSSIVNFDFSEDSKFIRISVNKDELFYYSFDNNELFQSPTTINGVLWNTVNVPYSFDVQGVWSIAETLGSVTAISKCINKDLIAVSYESGEIRVYQYPCYADGEPNFVTISSVILRTTSLSFSTDGKYLIVLDAYTRSIVIFNL